MKRIGRMLADSNQQKSAESAFYFSTTFYLT